MRATTLIFAAAVMQLLGPRPAFVRTAYAEAASTDISEVVIYGIDSDTNELMRYNFKKDTFTVIGVVENDAGKSISDTEALTWVPSGPAKGMYCIPRDGHLSGDLVRVNPLDASAEVVFKCPWDDITAMVTVPVGPAWVILAWDVSDDELVAIDPLARTATKLFGISGIPDIEGFAVGPDGTFYANTDLELFTIDLVAETATLVGVTGARRLESLEFAFGDYAPQIDIDGIPSSWTANGALVGFDDTGDIMKIVDPVTGSTRDYPCSFATVDCEGLVVMTRQTDPYGAVVVDACD